jgi:hypothetical protein
MPLVPRRDGFEKGRDVAYQADLIDHQAPALVGLPPGIRCPAEQAQPGIIQANRRGFEDVKTLGLGIPAKMPAGAAAPRPPDDAGGRKQP